MCPDLAVTPPRDHSLPPRSATLFHVPEQPVLPLIQRLPPGVTPLGLAPRRQDPSIWLSLGRQRPAPTLARSRNHIKLPIFDYFGPAQMTTSEGLYLHLILVIHNFLSNENVNGVSPCFNWNVSECRRGKRLGRFRLLDLNINWSHEAREMGMEDPNWII